MLDWGGMVDGDLQAILDEEDNVKTRIIFAREELKVIGNLVNIKYTGMYWELSVIHTATSTQPLFAKRLSRLDP